MSTPELLITPNFASPIITAHYPNAALLNAELQALFLGREAEGERYRKKIKTATLQIGIFESEFDLFRWPDACVGRLRDFCAEMTVRAVQQLNEYTAEDSRYLKIIWDSWFHVTRHGGYISSHTHPNASWSGVYCVTPGEPAAEHPDSGVLRFLDIRPHSNMYTDLGNARMRRPFGPGTINFRLRPGQLVLFPSYMVHETGAFMGHDERITVAFNCSFADSRSPPRS